MYNIRYGIFALWATCALATYVKDSENVRMIRVKRDVWLAPDLCNVTSLHIKSDTDQVVDFPPETLSEMSAIKSLRLTRVKTNALPPNLERLEIYNADLGELTECFFNKSSKLKHIDLRDNRVSSVEAFAFWGLWSLESLWLSHNDLDDDDLLPLKLTPFPNLTDLRVNGNPIGDFCEKGEPSGFKSLIKLQKLDLSSTGATRLCSDWMKDMRQLSELKFQNNSMDTLVCEDLDVRRNVEAVVDLSGNMVNATRCNQQKAEKIVNKVVETKGARVIITSRIDYSCGWSFMQDVVRSRKLMLDHPNKDICATASDTPLCQPKCEASDD